MPTELLKNRYKKLLDKSGIHLNGEAPWDIRVKNPKLYKSVLLKGSLGFGEAYMDNWWECDSIDQMTARILCSGIQNRIKSFPYLLKIIHSKLMNLQKIQRAFHIGEKHYDLSNDLFEKMLDKRMIYSCAYWKNANTLDEAQEAKLKLTFDKLILKPGMKVLDIGCGWGGAARYAVENYGVSVVGITVSKKQVEYAQKICQGLPIDIRLQDYRKLNEKYDRIYSIGMFEHVGYKNYQTYMKIIRDSLKEGGLFLLHTIGKNSTQFAVDAWTTKYIFPNGQLPSLIQITKACEKLFIIEDWHNFGMDYSKTLLAWFQNFDDNWHTLQQKYDNRFYRMWKYYLLACAGVFQARDLQTWQIVLSPTGVKGGYHAPR